MTHRTQTDPTAPAREALQAALAEAASVDLSWIQPPPTSDGWTLTPEALRFLTSLVQHLKPRHILEFGSGLSTRVLARAGEALRPPCTISSVDHDPQFAATDASGGRVRVQVAPLVVRDCGGKLLPLYHLQPGALASQQPVDLVVIDGPPVNLGGREGTLYQAMDFARPGTLALLDDAGCAEEKAILARWQESLGDAIEVQQLPGFTRGMAAVLIRRPVRRAELWAYRERLTRQEIETRVPCEQPFILVDQNCWGNALVPERRCLPFLERAGEYWGAPEDDATAIRELERLRKAGAGFIAFVWPADWWLDRYAGFVAHLRSRYRCVIENDRLTLFELRGAS